MQRTAIPLSKTKVFLILFICLVFVAIGYWMFNFDASEIESRRRYNSPLFVNSIGLISMFFGGIGMIPTTRKLFDSSPGLTLDERGLTDNSSAFSWGFIPWSDIIGFEERQIQNQRILYVLLNTPQKYIAKFNPIRRILFTANMGMAASPVAIASSSLKIAFDELVSLVNQYLSAQRLIG